MYWIATQPYEAPDNPELSLKTVNRTIGETVLEVIELLEKNGIIPRAANDKVGKHFPKISLYFFYNYAWTSRPQISELYVPESELAAKKKEAETLKSVEISKLSLQWLQVLAEGWASPLSGEISQNQIL